MSTKNCVFCEIIGEGKHSSKVHENEDFLAIHDKYPKAPIHILIIPKVHVETFHDAKGELLQNISLFSQEVADKLGLNETGYRLVINNGKASGQEIMHFHFNLLGGTCMKWNEPVADPRTNI